MVSIRGRLDALDITKLVILKTSLFHGMSTFEKYGQGKAKDFYDAHN